MKTFAHLTINKPTFFGLYLLGTLVRVRREGVGRFLKLISRVGQLLTVCLFIICNSTSVVAESKLLPDEVQIHGFLTQGFFHSSDNNVYGQSDDGISPGLTEIGLNLSYQPWDRLRFATQGLYRRAGAVDSGSVSLEWFGRFNAVRA